MKYFRGKIQMYFGFFLSCFNGVWIKLDFLTYYFSKKPKQLTIAEQALLVGMIKGPSWYHPVKQPQRALARRNIVLDTWLSTAVIDRSQWQLAKQKGIELSINDAFSQHQFKDFLGLVKQQLKQSFSAVSPSPRSP